MIKRTVEISREPAHLSVELDQLLIQQKGVEKKDAARVPCEDIGVVLVDHYQTTYSHAALARLMEFGAAVVICGKDHLPVGLLLPMAAHTELVPRLADQIAAGKPLCNRLWQQIVLAKIRAQANNLPADSPQRTRLQALAGEVKSGDTTNVEAQAAKIYWSAWLGADTPFRRDPEGDGLNAMLNYGYAVLRAAVGRTLVAAGLNPSLGLHHSNRSNAFCLADDLVEPIRPLVDAKVRDLHEWGMEKLDQGAIAHLLGLLTTTVRVGETTGPLMVGLHRTAASLVRCLGKETDRLELPVVLDHEL